MRRKHAVERVLMSLSHAPGETPMLDGDRKRLEMVALQKATEILAQRPARWQFADFTLVQISQVEAALMRIALAVSSIMAVT